jgi:hypothetical protein
MGDLSDWIGFNLAMVVTSSFFASERKRHIDVCPVLDNHYIAFVGLVL